MTTKTYHKVIPTSLSSLFRYQPSTIEHDRRAAVARQVIRYATQQVAKINTLSNMLMQLWINHLITQNQPIPLHLSDKNQSIWNWCTHLCTKLDGIWKTHDLAKPTSKPRKKREVKKMECNEEMEAKKGRKRGVEKTQQEEKEEKRKRPRKNQPNDAEAERERIRAEEQKQAVKDALESEKQHERQKSMFLSLQHVFVEQFKPLFPPNFKWPDRSGVLEIMHVENGKRRTAFNTMYSTTLLSRQSKVIRAQISDLPSFQQLVLEDAKKKAIRYLCTRYMTYHINRWNWTTNFQHAWDKQAPDLDAANILADLHLLIGEHQQAFGPPTTLLHLPFYRLSEDDAMKHGAGYVDYFHYLAQQYTRFAAADDSRVKWKSFSIIPQTKHKIPFVEISAKAILELRNLSEKKKVKKYVKKQMKLYKDESDVAHCEQLIAAVKVAPTIDWLTSDKELTTRWAQDHQNIMFDLLLSPSWRHMLKRTKLPKHAKTTASKHQQLSFECLISTDGQQARVHVSTVLNKSETDTSISSDLFDSWIAEHKQIISVDPGHTDLIAAVRHGQERTALPVTDRPKSRKGKLKFAKMQREAESEQSVYQLSNKTYHEMCDHTASAASRLQWRQKSKLTDMDLYLSEHADTCNARTWVSTVYTSYIEQVILNWKALWKEMSQNKYQKLRFRTFQKQARAFHTIANDLSAGQPKNTVLLWGAGSFGPTLRGHAAAPNKLMRKKLTECGMQIYMIDEYNTSKHTAYNFNRSVYSKQRQCRKQNDPSTDELKKTTLRGLLYDHSAHQISPFVGYRHRHAHGIALVNEVALSGTDGDGERKKESHPWNRDVCSAINIFLRAFHECHGAIPLCFTRPKREAYEDDVGGVAVLNLQE